MKITCPKERLLNAISQVQGAVSPRTTLPILSNVLLEAEGKNLTLTTTDLDIGIQISIPVEVEESGSTTVPAKRLFGIIRELYSGTVNISVNSNNITVITCGNARFKIVGLGKEEFPKLPEFPDDKGIEIPQVLLKEMINKTSYAVSNDESRYVLNGIYFLVKSKKAIMVATDGRRLAMIEKHVGLAKGVNMEVIVPSKTVAQLVKVLGDEGSVEIVLTKNQIAFKIPGCILISRLIEGRFPNYNQVIPEKLDQKVNLSREELLSAVRRSSLVTSDRSNSVRFNFVPNQLIISANAPDVGEARENIDIAYKGQEIDIAFNPRFVIDVLKNLDVDDVFVELTDGANPGVIRTGPDFLYVLMPMRLT